ncbi:MAG TPA: hypothetical protein PLJ26_02540 [Candidatus Omnitrophota bacterium]|nr:hypothetical protein [Candidatus Omnitrophota bacterium]
MMKRGIAIVACAGFVFQQVVFAQISPQMAMPAYLRSVTPPAGAFHPVQIRSIVVNPSSGRLDVYVDAGSSDDATHRDVDKNISVLMEYFRIGLSLPDSSFWVNLRPDAPDRVIDSLLEKTDMGRVLLAADVELKKDLCRLTDPNSPLGREYWNKLYARAMQLYNTEDIQIPTITRPWIIPGEIVLGETKNGVYIYKALLKVMLEQDYIKTEGSIETGQHHGDRRQDELNEYSTYLLKEKILPLLARELNSSRKYASLRQAYFSLILAQWYKSNMAGSLSGMAVNSKDLRGLTSKTSWSKKAYFEAYQRSFSGGEYARREYVSDRSGLTMREYISGGASFVRKPEYASVPGVLPSTEKLVRVPVDLSGKPKDGGLDDNNAPPQEPDDAMATYLLAASAHKRGDLPAVMRAINDLIALNTDNTHVLKITLSMLMAINNEMRGHPDKDILLSARQIADRLTALEVKDRWVKDIARKVSINLMSFPGAVYDTDIVGLDDNALFQVVELLVAQGQERFAEARHLIARIVAIPDTPTDVLGRAGLFKLNIALQEDDLDAASEAVKGLLDLRSDNTELYRKASFIFTSEKRHRTGPRLRQQRELELDINSRRIELDPQDYKAWTKRYQILQSLGREKEADDALAQSLRIKRSSQGLILEFYRLLRDGLHGEAIQVIDEALGLNPKDIKTHSQKIQLLIRMGRNEQAWEALVNAEEQCVEEAARDAYIQVQKAILLRLRKEYAQALAVLEALDPRTKEVSFQKILVFIASGDLDSALQEAHEAMKKDPGILMTYYSLIRQLVLHKRYQDALSLIAALEGNEPDTNSVLIGYKFDCLLGLGEDSKAAALLHAMKNQAYGDEGALELPQRILDYEDKWLRYLLLREYMLKGADKARQMIKDHKGKYIMAQFDRRTDTYRRLCEHIEHVAGRSRKFGPGESRLPLVRMEHIIKRHRYDPNSANISFTGYFPAHMDEDAIISWIEAGQSNLFAMRNLPEDGHLDWWPRDVYVSYFTTDGSSELVRMVFVVSADGRVITCYPTSGPGVFYAIGNEPISSRIASLNPHRLMVWNKQSEKQVYVLSEGMLALVNDSRLSKLDPPEREQLAWLAVTQGTVVASDSPEFEYYSYKIPYAGWQQKLGSDTVVVKIDKKNQALAGLESLKDGGLGGIDLRRLSAGQVRSHSSNDAPAYTPQELVGVWGAMQNAMSNGTVVFADMGVFARACMVHGKQEYLAGINDYLAMVLKREEECAVDMQPDIKNFLHGISLTN